MQAGAAELVLLDQHHRQAELGGAQRGGVTAADRRRGSRGRRSALCSRHVDTPGSSSSPRRSRRVRRTPHLVTSVTTDGRTVPTGSRPDSHARCPARGAGRMEEADGTVAWSAATGGDAGKGTLAARRPISSTWGVCRRPARGVEAFIEPRTTVTETTVVLVAHDGEWTRRRVDGPEGARRSPTGCAMPIYDVRLVGYPQRMRDHNARQRILRTAAPSGADARRAGPGPPAGRHRPRRRPRGRRQPFAAMSSSIASRRAHRHAGAALGPVAVRPAGVVRRAGDVDVRPRQPVRHELAQEHPRPSMPPPRSPGDVRDVGDPESMPRTSSGSGIGQAVSPTARRQRPPGRAARRCPSPRPSACPSATTWPPVSVEVSIR